MYNVEPWFPPIPHLADKRSKDEIVILKRPDEKDASLTLEQHQDIVDIVTAFTKFEQTGEIKNFVPPVSPEEVEVIAVW